MGPWSRENPPAAAGAVTLVVTLLSCSMDGAVSALRRTAGGTSKGE